MTVVEKAHEEIVEVDLDKIEVNPYQPRRHFDEGEIEELAASIRAVGLLHPPLVRRKGDGESFEIVSGERRCRAAKCAGLKRIHVLVREVENEVAAEAALVENIQRVDLNPLEIAKGLKRLMEEFGCDQEEVSERVGKKRSTVANYLRLLSLPQNIQDSLSSGAITMGHAKAILSLEGVQKQNLLHEKILRDHLSVREAEEEAQKIGEKKRLLYLTRDFYLEELAQKVEERFGTKVVFQHRGQTGKIIFEYYSVDDLERLIHLLGIPL